MQARQQPIQYKRLANKTLKDKEPLPLKGEGLDGKPLKDNELQLHEHKRLGGKPFKDEEMLLFEDKDRQQTAQGRGNAASQAHEVRQ